METVCLISSRQIGFIPAFRLRVDSYRFILIISEEECSSLTAATLEAFAAVFIVRTIGSDGVLWRYDPEEVSDVIGSLDRRPSTLITFDEGHTLLVAELRERFGIAGATVGEIERYRNKLLMKTCVQDAGLKVPAAERLPVDEEWPTYEDLVKRLGTKLVIKPVSSAGTNAVNIVSSKNEFERARSTFAQEEMAFEVEEYVTGRLFHCDTIWSGEELRFYGCTEYVSHTVDFQHGAPLGGRAMLPESSLTQAISDYCVRAVQALGLRGVAQHTEVIVSPGQEITFVESGARPPGMLVAQMYEKAFNINIVEETLLANLAGGQAGQSPPPLPVKRDREAFYLVYPKGNGIVSGVNESPIKSRHNVAVHIHSKVGERHLGCRSNVDFVGTALAWGSATEMEDVYETLKNYKPINYDQ